MSFIVEVIAYLFAGTFYWWWTWNLTFFGLAPNLIYASALAVAILAGPVRGMAWGFFLGLYADMLGGGPFGGYAFTYTLMAYLVHQVKRQFDMDSFIPQVVAAVILSFFCMLCYMGVCLVFTGHNPVSLKIFLAEPFLNALAVPVVFLVFYWAKRRFGIL